MSEHKETLHIHRTHPIILGGDPEDEGNITFVPKLQHAELCTFWNRKILELKSSLEIKNKREPDRQVLKGFPVTIEFAESFLKVEFPNIFRKYLQSTNGVEGEFQNQYLNLWGLAELVQLNEAYNVQEFAPNLLLFGSDGGEDAFAFERSTMHIVRIPFIGMSYVAIEKIADSFTDFLGVYFGND